MRKYAAVFLLALMAACSTPKVTKEQQPVVNLAYGYVMLAQVRLLAADAVRQKLLSPDEGRRALELTDTARRTLDASREAYLAGVEGADVKGFKIAETIIVTLRNDIESKITQRKEKAPK